MLTEDGYIIRKCLEGESEAFAFLIDKYKTSVYAFAYGKLRNFHDAEDITQEVFIKVYKKLPTLKHWDSFRAWLYIITSNECKALIRSRSNRPDHEFIEDQSIKALTNPSMDTYHENLMREMLKDALDSLPEMYSQVLTLHYLGGMSNKEIAAFLGTSIDSIKQRLSRARVMLREEVLAMMSQAYDQRKLSANFTFKIVEMVKRIKLHPVTPTQIKVLPYGLSLAVGLVITFLSINPLIHFDQFGTPSSSPLPVESKVLKIGEIPVDMVKVSNIAVISSLIGKGKGGEAKQPDLQNAFFMAPQGEGGEWIKKDNLPGVIGYHSDSVVNGKIYLIGSGDSAGNAFSCVIEYNPDTGKCIEKTNMPTPRGYLGACVVDNKIYAVGGYEPGRVNSKAVEEYNPITDKWVRKADMPTERTALAISPVSGKIYAIGGFVNDQNLSTIEEYDPEDDKWIRKTDMPIARSHISSGVVRGKIYVIGGLVEDVEVGGRFIPTSIVEEYDPATDKWTKKANMLTARCLLSVCSANEKIYAIGGWDGIRDFSTVEIYNPVNDEWTKGADMPTGRDGFTASVVNGKIYAVGGYSKDLGWLSTVEEYTPEDWQSAISHQGKIPSTWGQRKQ